MLAIKLGGSVITDKTGEKRLRPEALAGLAKALARIQEPAVIVHGAGSFGHPLAKRSGVGSGPHSGERAADVARIGRDVRQLNLAVVDALIEAGRPAVSIPPSAVLMARDGAVETLFTGTLSGWLDLGFTPVTFGDVVFDRGIGVAIVSGDLLMYEVSRATAARMAVFVSDVDGVFDRSPRDKGARLLDVVTPRSSVAFGDAATDVTGALEGKLRWMFRIAGEGIETWIVNGAHPQRLVELVSTGRTRGTRVVSGGAAPG